MIDAFREEFEKLTPEEKKQKQRINSLDTPCQIFIISSPSKISHLLIKTHLEEMPDKSINLVTLNNVKFIEELEEIHKKIAPFDKNEDENTGRLKIHHEVGRSIKNSLVNFGKQIMQGTEVRGIFPGIGSMILHDSKLAIWDIHGELDSFDFVAYGKKLPSEYKAQYEQQQKEKRKETPEQIKEITPNHKSGFGVYCYPPVLIGEFEPTIKERIENKEHVILSENVILDEFDGSDLVITKEGLLGLQTSSKKTADSVFHVIMGTSLLSNLPLHAHKISELADLSFDITTKKISSSSWIESSLRNQQFRFDRFTPFPKPIVRLKISIEDMISIIQKSKEIWKAESNLENLKLILGAMTYLSNQEFSQSFILSWTIIEKHVYDLWEKKLTKSKISNQRIKSMSEWDLYRITEILHLDRTLSDDDYSEIGYLRGLRNGLFHDGQEVTLKQSTRCFEMAYEITSKQFNINKKIKFQEYLSF
jgi:hypothetical protein